MTIVSTLGIDLAKNSFSVHGVSSDGAVVLRRTVSRGKLAQLVGQLSPCLVGMEACSGAHEWALGLVPRQYSTGGKTRLGHITKRGDAYLRTLFVMGARAVLQRAARLKDPLSRWALAVQTRRGYHRACVAIAAKNARVAWALVSKEGIAA